MPIYIAVSSPEPALNRVFLPQSPFCRNISRHDEERSIHIALRPNMKTAEDGARERADTVPVLDCQACGALTPGERFRYFADQIICEACDERNPQSRRRLVPRALLQPRDICVNFVNNKGLGVQAIALDCRIILGPQLLIQSAETMRRLLAYLGATPEQIAAFDSSHRRWGQGTVTITLQPGRKNLLRIDYQRL